jgi:group I intron endonuclease
MGTPKRWVIYCHTHIASGRRYIGFTSKSMSRRWHEHIQNSKHKTGKGCHHFWNAIRKYGKEAFTHRVLETCASLEEANEAERAWIQSYSATNPLFGFNLSPGGNCKLDGSDNSVNASDRARKLWRDPSYRARVTAGVSAANKDPSRVAALVARNKSMVLSEGSRARISASNLSRSCTEATRQKLSVVGIGRTPSNVDQLRAMGADRSAFLRARTHCKYGHSLHDAWVRKSDGERLCRTCSRLRKQSRREKTA